MSKLNIPESWAETEFENAIVIEGGSQPPKSDFINEPKKGYIRLIQIRDFRSDNHPVYIPLEKCKRLFTKDDIMIGRYGPPVFQILRGKEGSYNVALMKATPTLILEKEYMYWFLQNPKIYKDVNSVSQRSAGQTGVNLTFLNKYPVPIPPLEEQKRIVNKIESCFEKINSSKENLNKVEKLLEKYREAILAKAFHGELVSHDPNDEHVKTLREKIRNEYSKDKKASEYPELPEKELPFALPDNWISSRLYFAGTWGSGGTPLKSKKEFYGGKINWMKTGDLTNGIVNEIPDKITERGLQDIGGKIYPVGTVVIAMYGATIGKLGLLKLETSVNQACACCTSASYVNNEFLFYWLMFFREHYISLGQGGAQPNISRSVIYEQFFAIPPMDEQLQIVNEIKRCFKLVDNTKESIKKKKKYLTELKDSILQKAFEGQFVDQISSEGTGHELLEKILARKENFQKPETDNIKIKTIKNKAPSISESAKGKKNGKK